VFLVKDKQDDHCDHICRNVEYYSFVNHQFCLPEVLGEKIMIQFNSILQQTLVFWRQINGDRIWGKDNIL
jgi:hypothetical protein